MKFCPSCGTALAGASRFCANCGAPLAVATPTAAAPPAPPRTAPPTVPMPAQPAATAQPEASPSAGLPPLRAARRQVNWPALVVGLLAIALIGGGISFLAFRDDPADPAPTPTTTVAASTTTSQP